MRTAGRAILAFALVAELSACSLNGPPPQEIYQASARYPDERAANDAWERIMKDQPVFIDGMTLSGGYFGKGRFFVKSIGFHLRSQGFPDDYFVIEPQKGGGETVRIPLQNLPNPIRVLQIQPPMMTKYIVVITDDLAIVPDRAFQSIDSNPIYGRQTALHMADILSTMREFASESTMSDSQWRQVVNDYPSTRRPPITEEMRRYAVEAESLIKQKRFSDAAKIYAEALRRWPWWSQARYMRALVLGELKRYTYAAKEMTRYLQLEPSAPDYRRLQDQVYEWESYARR